MRIYFLLVFFFLIFLGSSAQDQHLVDSLLNKLKSEQQDTSKVLLLINLSAAHWDNNLNKATDYANEALNLSQKINYKKGIGLSYNSMGVINRIRGDYLPGLEWHKKALQVREEMNDKRGIAASYNGIGNIYLDLGNYPEALKNHLAALKIREENGDKEGMSFSYANIGNIYKDQGNLEQAMKMQLKALELRTELGNKKLISESYSNIGNVYFKQGNYTEALQNRLSALKIEEEIGNKRGMAYSYYAIGDLYAKQENYEEALKNHLVALKLEEEMEDKDGYAYSYINIGGIYTLQKKYKNATEFIDKGMTLAKEIGSLDLLEYAYKTSTQLNEAQGNSSQALSDYKLYVAYRDSIVNNEKTKKTMQMQMQYDFDKKEANNKAAQEKKDAITRQTLFALIVGLIAVLIFAFVFLGQRIKIAKGKKKSDELLLNILPLEVAEELKQTGTSKTKKFEMVTVMFTDFKDFTKIGEDLSAELLVAELNTCFSAFDSILQKHNIEKIKTIGDAYMCVSGLPIHSEKHAHNMLDAALEIMHYIEERKKEREAKGEFCFELRIGINSGPVVAGIVGVKKFSYDIWGDTVNLASRMEKSSIAGKINISSSTYALVKDEFSFTYRGKIPVKGKGERDMFFVERSLGVV